MSEPGVERARIRRAVAEHPHLLAIWDPVVALLVERSDVAVIASGSLGAGTLDCWSDLDLEVVVLDPGRHRAVQAELRAALPTFGEVLASFPADHVGLPDLDVTFYAVGDTVAKLDLWVTAEPVPGVVIHDPEGRLGEPASHGPPPLDVADLHHKLTGWCWYTITKVARGELLEAADSLAVMRSRALLPCLLWLDGQPREGFRRAERRLSPAHLALVREVRPRSLHPSDLKDAVLATARAFASVADALDEEAGRRVCTADLDAMIRRVADVPV